ncbi:MAG: hypothetical protein JWM05_3110, partial [Acidimicrobiales bacterium]|nr:hypothetical protein [Acidimicrobiales bacterium]
MVQSAAGEFALGLLTGSERAAVVSHLHGCRVCRHLVDVDAVALDLLLAAGPEVEPPADFEGRVLARIAAESGATGPDPSAPELSSRSAVRTVEAARHRSRLARAVV